VAFEANELDVGGEAVQNGNEAAAVDEDSGMFGQRRKLERFPALCTSLSNACCSDTITLTFCTLYLIQNTAN